MFQLNKALASACFMAAATFAHADTTNNINNFRVLTPVIVSDVPLTATLEPLEVHDEASASKGVLTDGDKISFEISGVEGASVYILNMNTAGDITMIYPNKFEAANKPEGDILMLPGDGAKYEFEVSGRPGTEVVKVLAVDGDATAFQALIASLFDQKQAFPRAINPAEVTTEVLADFFKEETQLNVRQVTFDYVIAK